MARAAGTCTCWCKTALMGSASLKALHARCWLAGFGWMMVGAGGQLLERSIVDRVVGAPERLIFEGPPLVVPPLEQDRGEPPADSSRWRSTRHRSRLPAPFDPRGGQASRAAHQGSAPARARSRPRPRRLHRAAIRTPRETHWRGHASRPQNDRAAMRGRLVARSRAALR